MKTSRHLPDLPTLLSELLLYVTITAIKALPRRGARRWRGGPDARALAPFGAMSSPLRVE
jgi:hypothetical protein